MTLVTCSSRRLSVARGPRSQFSFSHFFYRQSQVEQPPRSLSSFRSVCMVGRAGLEPAVCLCNGFTVRPLRR